MDVESRIYNGGGTAIMYYSVYATSPFSRRMNRRLVKTAALSYEKYKSLNYDPRKLFKVYVEGTPFRKYSLTTPGLVVPFNKIIRMTDGLSSAHVLSAIKDGVGEVNRRSVTDNLKYSVPALRSSARCPLTCGTATITTLWYIIIHLNDVHKWTREQIADWLDTLDVDLSIREAGSQ